MTHLSLWAERKSHQPLGDLVRGSFWVVLNGTRSGLFHAPKGQLGFCLSHGAGWTRCLCSNLGCVGIVKTEAVQIGSFCPVCDYILRYISNNKIVVANIYLALNVCQALC